ncbi:REP-associated tyrosine transposase [Legionella sp. CNM-4043-24]|uniref:REP-associated tyrosine transposase n=1 Tax=Legionella sp. CNM-4043-24 TaxID=3421646 RepID=UPI00403A8A91
MNYRRVIAPGASYFFTLTLQDRRSDLLICKINELRHAFKQAIQAYPFTIDGIVVLPEHMHMCITLPPGEANYSQRISFVKSAFSRQVEPIELISSSRQGKRERGIWQRRFWEHIIRDEQDYERHLNYIHYNPVKHGYVESPSQWPYSSIHRYINSGILPMDWTTADAEIKSGE